MPSADPLDTIASEGARFVELARQDLERPVPQYADWKMSGLVAHTGAILGRTTLVCRDLLKARPTSPRPAEGEDVVEWFEGQLEGMLAALRETDHATEVWGFGPTPTVAFWVRRMLVEIGIHRWDAESAFGAAEPLVEPVARAGLDEYPEMWLPRLEDVQTLRMTATDLGEDWVFGVGEPSSTVEGTASDLYLRLMSRPSVVVIPEDWTIAVDTLDPPPK